MNYAMALAYCARTPCEPLHIGSLFVRKCFNDREPPPACIDVFDTRCAPTGVHDELRIEVCRDRPGAITVLELGSCWQTQINSSFARRLASLGGPYPGTSGGVSAAQQICARMVRLGSFPG